MHNDSHIVSLKPKPQPVIEERPPHLPPPTPRRRSRGYGRYYVAACVLVLIAGLMWYFWPFSESDTLANSDDTRAISEESQNLIETVGRLIVLPEGEEPTIATVTDPEKLRDQVFFANAKEGDKVLIYTKARKAYLYDPGLNKLIEVAPLTVEITQ